MLSSTNSLNDVKRLLNDYKIYNYEQETDFSNDITESIDHAKYEIMIPAISDSLYKIIETKDKESLNIDEHHIYFAEVYLSASMFLSLVGHKQNQKKKAQNESFSQAGITKTYAGLSGILETSNQYRRDGYKKLQLAGYIYAQEIDRFGVSTAWRYAPEQRMDVF